MKKLTSILMVISYFVCGFGQDSIYRFNNNPDTLFFNKLELKTYSISADDYNSHKQKVVRINSIDYKEYSKNNDSIKKIFKLRCPYIFKDNNCIQLHSFDNSILNFCLNTKPADEKEFLSFYFVGLDNQFATIYITPYEGATYYIINLNSKICYPGDDSYTNKIGDIIYGFNDYISYSIYIYDLKNNRDITLRWGGFHDIINDFYLLGDKFLRLKLSTNYNDKNYKYISIQIRK